jgi:hypothetical protein
VLDITNLSASYIAASARKPNGTVIMIAEALTAVDWKQLVSAI